MCFFFSTICRRINNAFRLQDLPSWMYTPASLQTVQILFSIINIRLPLTANSPSWVAVLKSGPGLLLCLLGVFFFACGRYIVCGRERTCLVYGRKQTFPSCLREKRTISDCYIAYRQGKLEEIFINN